MKNKFYGLAGLELRIMLNEGKIIKIPTNVEIIKKYFGGVGYAARILYDELKPNAHLLSSNNKLIFATGLLTDPRIPGGGSLEICFKSPLTNIWGESRIGGEFGINLKKAGYDYLIIEGIAKEPSFLIINDEKVEVKSACNLRGKTTSEKEFTIKQQLSESGYSILTIGPAGENKVLFSSAMVGGRAAGRTGVGAVLGSKNLLAIAVKGTKKIPVFNYKELKKYIRKVNKRILDHPNLKSFKEHGTTGDIPLCDDLGDWPTKNWQSNSWGNGKNLYEYFLKHNLVKNKPCYKGCPIACGRIAVVKEGKYKTPIHKGAEYESISAFTAFVLNDNMDAAVHSTYLCNEYGLDTISTGSVIAFIMDCYADGIISKKQVDGLNLEWGNYEVLPLLVKKIALRRGIGDLLANGVKRIAKKLGKDAEKLAIHGKGLEAPAHDPRSGKALAVSYGTGNRGMCHIHPIEATAYEKFDQDFGLIKYGLPNPKKIGRWQEEKKGFITKILQDAGIIPDILGTCKFFMYLGVTLDDYAQFISSIIGEKINGLDMLTIGAVSYTHLTLPTN
mgnify:CR=1 FL=1